MAFDFSGWVTRNDLKCTDGRTIRKDAFKHNDGNTVPLVWQHIHNDPMNVLGHVLLENKEEGVYGYGSFNDTEAAKHAKELVSNGDITALSIYANRLKQKGGDVLHGEIREVSLVLTGANPGAFIDVPVLAHSGEEIEDEAIIYTGEELVLSHADDSKEENEKSEETVQDVLDTLDEKQKEVVYSLLAMALQENKTEKKEKIEHADQEEDTEEIEESSGKTVGEIYDTLTEKQKKVVNIIVGQALSGDDEEDEEMSHADDEVEEGETIGDVFDSLSDEQKDMVYVLVGQALEDKESGKRTGRRKVEHSEGGDTDMKYNVFDRTNDTEQNNAELMHAAFNDILKDAKKCGSFKEAFEAFTDEMAHAEEGPGVSYGIKDLDFLFPDAKQVGDIEYVKREMDWVQKILSSVHRSPFARIKTLAADITADEARAKGYIKGNRKKEEVFTLLKRTTSPTTIYKKQKMDRDDIIDITDFDVIAWLKAEMRMMLDEEIARAILVGDGRSTSDDDKIPEINIRPIYSDESLFTVRVDVAGATEADQAKNFITACIKNRKQYKGSGNPTLFVTEDMLTEMLLLEDGIGHKLYKTEGELATALRVKEIVSVPVMEGMSKDGKALAGIVVNLSDYNVGADKGGAVEMFDDFDIDYNQQKYLIETRCSGALVKPFSAIVLELTNAA